MHIQKNSKTSNIEAQDEADQWSDLTETAQNNQQVEPFFKVSKNREFLKGRYFEEKNRYFHPFKPFLYIRVFG